MRVAAWALAFAIAAGGLAEIFVGGLMLGTVTFLVGCALATAAGVVAETRSAPSAGIPRRAPEHDSVWSAADRWGVL